MVTCPEIVKGNTKPACQEDNNCRNDLTWKSDVLLEDVKYAPDSAYETYDVKNCSHSLLFDLIKIPMTNLGLFLKNPFNLD